MMKNYEVAVLGAGVIGQGIALSLAEHGTSTAIIDPSLNTDGAASPAAGAMIDAFGENELRSSTSTQSLLQMRLKSQKAYRHWLKQIEQYSDQKIHKNDGMFIIANAGGDHDIEHFKQIRSLMEKYDEPYQDADPSEVPGLQPNIAFNAHSAIFMPGALSVDSASLLSGLSKALCTFNLITQIREKVIRLEKVGLNFEVTLSNQQVITAKNVVLAAGARSTELLSKELRIEAGLPQIYYGRGISCITSDGPNLPHAIRTPNRALSCGIHLVPRAGGQIYLGATNLFGMDLSLPKGPSVGELHSMLGMVCNQLNTTLRNVSVSDFFWGLRPLTADGLPILGATKITGLFVATAMHRVGINLAPEVKDILCNEILGLNSDVVNPFPLRNAAVDKTNRDIGLGMRSLLATVLYPDGHLPYNRNQELEVFLTELFNMAINGDNNSGLRRRMVQLYNHIEMDEQAMIRVFHEVLNDKIPEMGPFSL